MQQTNPPPSEVRETLVVGSIRLQEQPFKVKVPVFENVTIERPVFVEKQIEIPTGWDKVINQLALEISKSVIELVEVSTSNQIKLLEEKIAQLKNMKIEENVIIREVPVEVDKPIYKDVEVSRPIYVDKEIINHVRKDVEVLNAVIIDHPVTNAVISDIRVTNAIIRDVEVERAVIREKVVEVVHKQCIDGKGNIL